MTLPTILPTQGPDPYNFSKINLGEKIGKGLKKGAKYLKSTPKMQGPIQQKQEAKPMLALPPGKGPAPKEKFVRQVGGTRPDGTPLSTRAWRVAVPRQLPLSAYQQRVNDAREKFVARSTSSRVTGQQSPHGQRRQAIAEKKAAWNNKNILRGGTSIGTTKQNPGSDVHAAANFSGRPAGGRSRQAFGAPQRNGRTR